MPTLPAGGAIWADEIASRPIEPVGWVWEGLIARSNLTLLTSQWKAGKTTLLSVLLGARVAGGEVGGLAVRPGKTLVVTEEPLSLWAERARKHQLGASVCFFSQPFRTIPTEQEWQGLVQRALDVNERHGIDLVVIDPLAPFLRSKNHARGMLETLLPLGQLLRKGLAGLLLHHPGRGERAVGQAARVGRLARARGRLDRDGHPGGDPLTRRRRLFTLSRHADSPRRLTLELDEAGMAYRPVAESAEVQLSGGYWELVRVVLEEAPQKLTQQDILLEWPPGSTCRPARRCGACWAGRWSRGWCCVKGAGGRTTRAATGCGSGRRRGSRTRCTP